LSTPRRTSLIVLLPRQLLLFFENNMAPCLVSWCPGVLVSWACCLVRQTADTRTKGQPGRASTHTNNHFWWRPTKDSRPLLCPPGRTPAASPRVMITNGRSIIRFPADSPMDPIHHPEGRTCPAGRTMALGVSLKCIFISLG